MAESYWGQVGPVKPSDWEQMLRETGSSAASANTYDAWKKNKASSSMREGQLSDFVNRMATQDPNATANASRFQGDLANYGGRINSFLDTAAPTVSTSNRFESGLSDTESRLRALLDNPDSIQQSAAYKFRVGQGAEALQRSLGAKGMLNSGNRLMELTKYGQDMGSQEYDAQAGRLGNLLGNYSQSWLGDKNANTQQYAAQSNAWNQRGGLLKDLYANATTAANQNQQISGNDRNAWANTWIKQAPAPSQNFASGFQSGIRWG